MIILFYSRTEFEDLMRELGIHFSRKKWNHIFHEIDKNFDNMVTKKYLIWFNEWRWQYYDDDDCCGCTKKSIFLLTR